jgi:succinate dehydrogenase hydrophobic anchor subunit
MISNTMPKMIKNREKLRWVFQRLSGLQLLIFFGVHIWVFYFKLERPVALESLQEIFLHAEWIIFYVLFISLIIYHAFSGLWTVLTDNNPSKSYKKNWRITLWVIGVFLVLISAWNLILLGRA